MRTGGIAAIVFGVLVAVLGFTKILPNLGSTGIMLILLGGLFIGLSFIGMPDEEEGAAPMSFFDRITKVFYAPAELFQNLRSHPRWIGAVAVIAILNGIYAFAFVSRITPERITNYSIDKLAESGFVPEKSIDEVREQTLEANSNPVARGAAFVSGFVGTSFLVAFLAAIFLVVGLVFGGKINYWQALSVAAYAMVPITVIQRAASLLILYLKSPDEIHPILGQGSLLQDNLNFLVSAADSPVLYTLLTYFSLLGIYWLWLNSTGLKNAATRLSTGAGWTASILVWSMGLVLSVVMALLFGNMMS